MFIPHVCKGQLQNNHLPAPGDLSVPCLTSPRADFQSKAFLARAVWKVDQAKEVKARPLLFSEELNDKLETHIVRLNRGSEFGIADL